MNFQELNIVKTNDSKQWYMTIDQVAMGYGVEVNTITQHLKRHCDELRDGIERGVTNSQTLGGEQKTQLLL